MALSERIGAHTLLDASQHSQSPSARTRGRGRSPKAEVHPQKLSDALSMEVEYRGYLVQSEALDDWQAEHLALPCGLDVPAVSGKRRQPVAVQLADNLVQLCPVAELGALDQLGRCLTGELFNVVDTGRLKTGESGRAQGQLGEAHGQRRASERQQVREAPCRFGGRHEASSPID